jgi:hypothetical protein
MNAHPVASIEYEKKKRRQKNEQRTKRWSRARAKVLDIVLVFQFLFLSILFLPRTTCCVDSNNWGDAATSRAEVGGANAHLREERERWRWICRERQWICRHLLRTRRIRDNASKAKNTLNVYQHGKSVYGSYVLNVFWDKQLQPREKKATLILLTCAGSKTTNPLRAPAQCILVTSSLETLPNAWVWAVVKNQEQLRTHALTNETKNTHTKHMSPLYGWPLLLSQFLSAPLLQTGSILRFCFLSC